MRKIDRAGVRQAVAMRLSGHKTASVYRRYLIVVEDDLREALARTQASLATRPAGTVTALARPSSARVGHGRSAKPARSEGAAHHRPL
jgi:hypothetical protein